MRRLLQNYELCELLLILKLLFKKGLLLFDKLLYRLLHVNLPRSLLLQLLQPESLCLSDYSKVFLFSFFLSLLLLHLLLGLSLLSPVSILLHSFSHLTYSWCRLHLRPLGHVASRLTTWLSVYCQIIRIQPFMLHISWELWAHLARSIRINPRLSQPVLLIIVLLHIVEEVCLGIQANIRNSELVPNKLVVVEHGLVCKVSIGRLLSPCALPSHEMIWLEIILMLLLLLLLILLLPLNVDGNYGRLLRALI